MDIENKKELVLFLEKADKAFFNTDKPIVDDDLYDIIKEKLRKMDPKNPYFKRVGADEENKIKLPYWLGSLDKIKDEKGLNRWIKKYNKNYIISEKLDGISCLVYYDNKDIKLYTRGDGFYGMDITYIKDFINGINGVFINNTKIKALRGELIINKENWEKIKDFAGSNPRNVVAGAIHSKILNKEILKYIDFVVYDVLDKRDKIETSLYNCKESGFKVVNYLQIEKLDINYLSTLLLKWRNESFYYTDGLVITSNEDIYEIEEDKNPKYSFAFKMIITENKAEVIVNDIEWNISKDGYFKPIVKFDEIIINGVKIKQATGFNGEYIYKNGIGLGSRIVIMRSGDVIPHIIEVLTKKEPLMPKEEYIWNETKKDIIIKNKHIKNRDKDISEIVYFMKTLNILNVGEGIIIKLYDSGYDDLIKIINIKEEDLLKIEGIKEKLSKKIFDSIQEIKNKKCYEIMAASNILGRGFSIKKIKLITDEYDFVPDDKNKTLKIKEEDLIKIKGIAKISAKTFINNLKDFYIFYEKLSFKCKKEEVKLKPIANQETKPEDVYVFSGFRNKELKDILISKGNIVNDNITSLTNYLIVRDLKKITTKIKKANETGIKIITEDELISKLS